MNKYRIYWVLQIGGWTISALAQIWWSYMASGSVTVRRVIFFVVEAILCIVVTHGFRNRLKHWKWLYQPMHKLIPGSLAALFIMGLIVYFLTIPVNFVLGRLFNPTTAFDLQLILRQSSFYFILFFWWTVVYFAYHYFNEYNKSLKYEASMVEIELNNLKSQLNPHFIFNALNSIRALVDENPSKVQTGHHTTIEYPSQFAGIR